MKSLSACLTILVASLLLVSGAQAQSKMERLKDSLHTKAETLAKEEIEDLSESRFDRLSRNMDRALERLMRNSDDMEHIIDEWEHGDSDWDHVAECRTCNRNAQNIFRGTGLEWMVPDLVERTTTTGLSSGTGTLTCGCHGFVQLGARRPNSACASGFDVAMACQGWCPAGGVPWGARCT